MLLFRRCISLERRRAVWPILVIVVIVAMVGCFIANISMSFSALVAASAMILLDGRDAAETLQAIDIGMLIFFGCLFITVEALTKTGLPAAGWLQLANAANLSSLSGTVVTSAVFVVLSNLFGNVPVVLILAQAAFNVDRPLGVEKEKAWLVLAWVSSVAGNFTPAGSVANAITIDRTREAGGDTPSFKQYIAFGVPVTVVCIATGLLPILLL